MDHPRVTTVRVGYALVAAVALSTGCLGRSLPIPPPGVSDEAVTVCTPAQCPSGGVFFTINGTAAPGAQVIVVDTNPATYSPHGAEVSGVALAASTGLWTIVLGPTPPDPVIYAPQRGDTLDVFQITPGNEGGVSNSTYIQIPLH